LIHEVLNDNITILIILKNFFIYVKHYGTNDDDYKIKYFNLSYHLNNFNVLKKKVTTLYQKLIEMYPNDKVHLNKLTNIDI